MTTTVIKSGAGVRHPHATAFSFDDMAQQAAKYVAEIRAQAAKIVADARREAETIRQRAEQEGRAAAMAAAERVLDEKVGKQMQTLLPALRQAVASIQNAKPDWLRHWEASAVHLAAAMAERIVRREVERVPEITLDLLREALELAVGSPQLTIRLHPDDHRTLGGQAVKLAAEISRLSPAELVTDPAVVRGSCRVDTEFGVIDQTFAAQLGRIEEELKA